MVRQAEAYLCQAAMIWSWWQLRLSRLPHKCRWSEILAEYVIDQESILSSPTLLRRMGVIFFLRETFHTCIALYMGACAAKPSRQSWPLSLTAQVKRTCDCVQVQIGDGSSIDVEGASVVEQPVEGESMAETELDEIHEEQVTGLWDSRELKYDGRRRQSRSHSR